MENLEYSSDSDKSNNTSDAVIVEQSQTNDFVDNITLELLMKKSQYNKYVSHKDPEKYIKMKQHVDKMTKYKYEIIDLTKELLDDPDRQISLEINEIFEAYVKKMINHFEMKEIESGNLFTPRAYNQDNNDDMMFEKMEEPVRTNKIDNSSLWGKRINKK